MAEAIPLQEGGRVGRDTREGLGPGCPPCWLGRKKKKKTEQSSRRGRWGCLRTTGRTW